MSIPGIILIIWLALSAGFQIAKWGEPKSGEYDGYDLLAVLIIAALLWWAGVWS